MARANTGNTENTGKTGSPRAIELEYRLGGAPSGETILLMMGSATPLVQWEDAFLAALGQAGYRTVVFDYRDTGRSSYVDAAVPDAMPEMMAALASGALRPPYSFDDLAGDVLGLLDALSVRAAHLFGLSLGGMLGQILAARAGGRVLSLTSVSATTSDPALPRPSAEMMKDLTKPLPTTREEYVAWHADVFSATGSRSRPPSRAWLEARALRLWEYCGFNRQAYLRHLLAAIGASDRTAMLAEVRAPTLILQGTEDPVQSIAAGEAQANAIPGARLHLVQGMGHDVLPEHLPEVTDLFLSFLRQR
jgi:pimeloyl-ACP methyl ester carboxylesterase